MMVGIALGASALGAFLNIRAYDRRKNREKEHGGGEEGQVSPNEARALGIENRGAIGPDIDDQ